MKKRILKAFHENHPKSPLNFEISPLGGVPKFIEILEYVKLKQALA